MAKSNNEDDGGWGDLERWANETDETDSSNASKPLSVSEQAALIEKSTPKVRTFWRGSVKMICDAAAECARTAKRLDAEHKKLYVKKLRFGNTVFNMLKRIGEDKRIPKNVKHLSPSISTIYEVSHLSNEQLKLGISEGIVNPGRPGMTSKSSAAATSRRRSSARSNRESVRGRQPMHPTLAGAASARPRSRKTMSFLRTRSFSRTTSRTIPNRLQRATTSMTRW